MWPAQQQPAHTYAAVHVLHACVPRASAQELALLKKMDVKLALAEYIVGAVLYRAHVPAPVLSKVQNLGAGRSARQAVAQAVALVGPGTTVLPGLKYLAPG